MKHFEIERRFLLYPCSAKRLLKKLGVRYETIAMRQFYLQNGPQGGLRYRKEGSRYVRTRKEGSGMCRIEEERVVGREEFERALAANRGGVVVKKRFVFTLGGVRYELDRFKKRLKGLNILEVEFESLEAARSFVLPDALRAAVVTEITGMRAFSNGALSRSMRIPAVASAREKLLAEVDERGEFLKASTRVRMGAFESGENAVKALLYTLVRSVRANRDAILAGDGDPERLHQLRVAMRKQRALLSQAGAILDSSWARECRERLAGLMRKTGSKRDLDVYLANMSRYRSLLPKEYREELERLEMFLRRRAQKAQEELEAFLRSGELDAEMEELERFCRREGGEGLGPEADSPVIFPVAEALKKRHAKVRKKGRRIGPDSEAERYHRLRIEVKKLRYLTEFFASVFEKEAHAGMLAKLKRLQSILGDHQDLEVQSRHLAEFLREEGLGEGKTREAISLLGVKLSELARIKRGEFREAFREFDETKELLGRMICHY